MKSVICCAAVLSALAYGVRTSLEGDDKTPQKNPVAAADTPKSPSTKADPLAKATPLQAFMRAKLSASTKILEGLALEDLDLVREGAIEMNKMSQAEQWRRSEDVLYRQFSADFRQTTSDLIEATKNHQFDRAALKWIDATMACIECHRYVRNKLVVEK
jgi:hypothetical protein